MTWMTRMTRMTRMTQMTRMTRMTWMTRMTRMTRMVSPQISTKYLSVCLYVCPSPFSTNSYLREKIFLILYVSVSVHGGACMGS